MPTAERSRLSESWLARRVYFSAAEVAAEGVVAGLPAQARNETDTAGVVLEPRVVQPASSGE